MATVRFEDFGGIAPGINPARLPDNAATIAHNCRLKTGRIEPLTEPEKDNRTINFEAGLTQIADAKSLYLWRKKTESGDKTEWIAWKGRVKVAPSNLAIDANSRLFVTGDTGFKDANGNENAPVMFFAQEYGYTKYGMIKAKLPKPKCSLVTEPSNPDELRYTYIFQTWVDRYGYESPVSEPSDEIEYNDGQIIEVGEIPISAEWDTAVARRFYKVITGTETEQIQFIAEQSRVGAKFIDAYIKVKDEDAGEILAQIEAPPAQLSDILWMPGGFYAGVDRSNNRTVCFSDINLPYSWPLAYQYTVKDDIVGIALTGNTLVVLTTGSPWVISGTAPESMSVTSLSSPYACVSADSICTLGSTAYFATHTGICAITEGSTAVTPLTDMWFSHEEWKKLNPSTARMVAHDGALFVWFEGGNGHIIDFGAPSEIKAVTTHDEIAKCVYEDVEGGVLCYVREGKVE